MKNTAYSIFFAALILLASCTSHPIKLQDVTKRIDTISMKITAGFPDTAYIGKTLKMLNQYRKQEPADTNTPKAMLKLAVTMEYCRMYDKAVILLEAVQHDYPNSSRAGRACLTQAFLYDNFTKELAKAKAKYTEFLQKYSNLDKGLTETAKSNLANLGKSPEELFNEMQAKAKSDSIKMKVQ